MVIREVPHALVQGILAYNQDPNPESYTGFVVTINGTVLRISRAFMSHNYMESLCKGGHLSESLQFNRSKSYDLLERDQRREVLRLLVGLFRFLDAKQKM
jgi:hypothetical protein